MRPEVAKFLHDIRQALGLLEDFTRGKSFADYQADALFIQHHTVWGVIQNELSLLRQQIDGLLAQAGPP